MAVVWDVVDRPGEGGRNRRLHGATYRKTVAFSDSVLTYHSSVRNVRFASVGVILGRESLHTQ